MAPNESDGNDGVVCNQAEMERALLQGEASVQLDKVALDERQLEALRGRRELGRLPGVMLLEGMVRLHQLAPLSLPLRALPAPPC